MLSIHEKTFNEITSNQIVTEKHTHGAFKLIFVRCKCYLTLKNKCCFEIKLTANTVTIELTTDVPSGIEPPVVSGDANRG